MAPATLSFSCKYNRQKFTNTKDLRTAQAIQAQNPANGKESLGTAPTVDTRRQEGNSTVSSGEERSAGYKEG